MGRRTIERPPIRPRQDAPDRRSEIDTTYSKTTWEAGPRRYHRPDRDIRQTDRDIRQYDRDFPRLERSSGYHKQDYYLVVMYLVVKIRPNNLLSTVIREQGRQMPWMSRIKMLVDAPDVPGCPREYTVPEVLAASDGPWMTHIQSIRMLVDAANSPKAIKECEVQQPAS